MILTLNKYLISMFGDQPLDRISKAEILASRVKMPRKNGSVGLSPSRIKKILMILAQVLAEGGSRYGFQSPSARIKPLKLKKTTY